MFSLQYAPYKKGGKGTLAERARQQGLEAPAQEFLRNPHRFMNFHSLKKAGQGKTLW